MVELPGQPRADAFLGMQTTQQVCFEASPECSKVKARWRMDWFDWSGFRSRCLGYF